MSSRAMLRRLDTAVRRSEDEGDVATEPQWMTEDELADDYEQWHAEGGAADEPDFLTAIAFLRDAVARARGSVGPPFDPPAGWRPGRDDTLTARDWRAGQFPDIREAIEWLQEMETRSIEGTPAVTEAEFLELAAWFLENRERLYAGADYLDLGNGERLPVWHLTYGVRKGARAEGAGKTAELIRQTQTAYPESNRG